MVAPSIDAALVRALLEEQHPDLRGHPIRPAGQGWDNALFRLGEDLVVRLPRRPEAAHLVDHELRWLPEVAGSLPDATQGGLDTAVPLRRGGAGMGYPWSWTVARWLPGEVAARAPLPDPQEAARRLGSVLAHLHRPAPSDAPANPYRGVPLGDRDHHLVLHLDRLDRSDRALPPGVTRGRVEDRWAELRSAEEWGGPPLWLHGDLHPANLLVHHAQLGAVIDWGDLTSGDPATDLSVAWALLPAPARATFRAAAGARRAVDDATWQRAEAWSLALNVAYLSGSELDSPLVPVARRTLAELLA